LAPFSICPWTPFGSVSLFRHHAPARAWLLPPRGGPINRTVWPTR
jgi:hypothetical protein